MRQVITNLNCQECQAGLDRFVHESLYPSLPSLRGGSGEGDALETGRVPDENPTALHLARCGRCSEMYIHLLDLATASHVEALCDAALDPTRAPEGLAGLLPLWRIQVAACNRLDDARGCAAGLAVLGMIHRQLGDTAEARSLHQMALEMAQAAGDLLSQVLSHADLATLELADGRTAEAWAHLAPAYADAVRLGQWASQLRLLALWGDAHRLEGEVEGARTRYREAEVLARTLDSPLRDLVHRRLELLSGATPRSAACPTPERLQAYYRGELVGAAQLLVAAHVRECEACARELAALARQERQGLAQRLSGALQVLEAALVSPRLQGAAVRGEEAGPLVYRAGQLEVILHRRPSPTRGPQQDLIGLVHSGGQEPEGIAEARAELYRGDRLIAVAPVSARGHFAFSAVEAGEYELRLLWGEREIRLRAVRLA